MAQSRERRNRRRRRTPLAPPSRPTVDPRRRNLRRIVIAFLIIIGLAGILAVSAPGDGSGAPPAPPASGRARVPIG